MPLSLRTTVEYPHQQIHEGRAFAVSSYDTDIDAAGPKYYRISVPLGGLSPHLEMELTLKDAGIGELFEAPTLTGQGTDLVPVNRNRNSQNVATLVVAVDPTVSAPGTLLGFVRVPNAGSPSQPVGGMAYERHEWLLRPGKNYLFRVTSDSDNNASWLAFNWYEAE